MSTPLLISFISYVLVASISIIFGLIYLAKNQFMPYHSSALDLSWSEVESKFQVLIIALMRAAGGGFLATGLAMLMILLIPWKAGDIWSIYGLPLIGLCTSSGSLYATLLVKTRTPGTPPVILSATALAFTVVGFCCSII